MHWATIVDMLRRHCDLDDALDSTYGGIEPYTTPRMMAD